MSENVRQLKPVIELIALKEFEAKVMQAARELIAATSKIEPPPARRRI